MFEFVNDNDYDCGQAAVCTFLAHHGYIPANQKLLSIVEKEFPPDIMFGWLGTSPGQVAEACKKWGGKIEEIHGEMEIMARLPAIVLIQDGELGGHWTVATEKKDQYIYLTNKGWVEYSEFLKLWGGYIPRLAGFSFKGYVHL
jgi:hypothetical protein